MAIAHIAFTCLSGAFNQALQNISPDSSTNTLVQTTQTIRPAQKVAPPTNLWQVFVAVAKEVTKDSPEDALLAAQQTHTDDMLQNARDLKKPLLKELPCKYGPLPPKRRNNMGPEYQFSMRQGLA